MAVGPELVRKLAVAGTRCYQHRTKARPDDDWASLLLLFTEVLELDAEVAVARGELLGLSPYDALVDAYTPGMTASAIEEVFSPLRAALPSLLGEVLEAQGPPGGAPARGSLLARRAGRARPRFDDRHRLRPRARPPRCQRRPSAGHSE